MSEWKKLKQADLADIMTLKEFAGCVVSNSLIPDDGSGEFLKKAGGDWFVESQTDVFSGDVPKGATHVAWYNK